MLQIPESQPQASTESIATPIRTEAVIEVSRRTFFSVFSAGCIAGIVAMAPQIFHKIEKEPLPDRLRRRILENKQSLLHTLAESVVFSGFQMKMADYLDAMQVSHGARAYTAEQYTEAVRQYPVGEFVQNTILVPLVEEAIFRLLPAAFLDDDQMHWEVGLPSTAFFCAIHNIGKNENGMTIHLSSLPILQFLLSQYCWYLVRQRGFQHAAAAHVAYNTLVKIDEFVREKLAADSRQNDLSSEQWESYDSASL